jgi:cyanophycinase
MIQPLVRRYRFCLTLFGILWLGSSVLFSQTAKHVHPSPQTYIEATLWPGMLYLYRDESLKLLNNELAVAIEKQEPITLIHLSSHTDLLGAIKLQMEQHTRDNRPSLLTTVIETELTQPATTTSLANSKRIYIVSDSPFVASIASLPPMQFNALISGLRSSLRNGGRISVYGSCQWLGMTGNDQERSALLNDCTLVEHDDPIVKCPGIAVRLANNSACLFSKRLLVSLGEAPIAVSLAETESHRDLMTRTLRKDESIDWTQWRRALMERQQPFFPTDEKIRCEMDNGSLVIGGGGGMPLEVWQEFVHLAGGEQSHIVILPTAVESPTREAVFEDRMIRNAGAKSVVTLPQVALDEVSSDAFLQQIDKATGIWFGGGRQWRFIDAYWGTPAWNKIVDVCRRGGVIGGSSAGATIQGDLLVRGAPAGNQIMIADGYRRGLGLLPNTAVDQHFSQRNRFRDLEGCLQPFPAIYGIGIDEQTALIVTAPNRCRVLGNGSVWCYPSSVRTEGAMSRSETKVQHQSGSSFVLE